MKGSDEGRESGKADLGMGNRQTKSLSIANIEKYEKPSNESGQGDQARFCRDFRR